MNNLKNSIVNKKILLAAHRGVNGGNIPCNSLESYLIAVNQGADIIELDISISSDRKLFLLHPGMEWVHIGESIKLPEMHSDEVKKLKLANQDIVKTQYSMVSFDEVLDALKGKCFINVDKFWSDPEMISKVIRDHGMSDQCIVKSVPKENTPELLSAYAYDMQYMAIIRDMEQLTSELKAMPNFIGCEVLFSSDNDAVVSKQFIDELHSNGKIVWGNSIVYNYKAVIASDHTDDKALLGDPEHGWGWFGKNGFDILQTDWLLACRQYLEKKGYRK